MSIKIVFILANSADPDEMPHLHCLLKYLFTGNMLQNSYLILVQMLDSIYHKGFTGCMKNNVNQRHPASSEAGWSG